MKSLFMFFSGVAILAIICGNVWSGQLVEGNIVVNVEEGGPILKGIQLGMPKKKAKGIYDALIKKSGFIDGFTISGYPVVGEGFIVRMTLRDKVETLDLFNVQDFNQLIAAIWKKFNLKGTKIPVEKFKKDTAYYLNDVLGSFGDRYFTIEAEKGVIFDCQSCYCVYRPKGDIRPATVDFLAKVTISEKKRHITGGPKLD